VDIFTTFALLETWREFSIKKAKDGGLSSTVLQSMEDIAGS
jgi:hypothetical protein